MDAMHAGLDRECPEPVCQPCIQKKAFHPAFQGGYIRRSEEVTADPDLMDPPVPNLHADRYKPALIFVLPQHKLRPVPRAPV